MVSISERIVRLSRKNMEESGKDDAELRKSGLKFFVHLSANPLMAANFHFKKLARRGHRDVVVPPGEPVP